MRTRSAIEAYLESPRPTQSPATQAWRTRSAFGWAKRWGAKPIASLRLLDLEQHIVALQAQGWAPMSLRREVGHLRYFGRWCIAHGLVAANPADGLPAFPTRPAMETHALREGDIARLLAASRNGGSPPWLHPIVLTALRTLLRISSILALEWADVDLEGGVLRVRPEIQKTRRGLQVPLTEDLRAWLAAQEPKVGRIFEAAPDRVGVWRAFKALAGRLGLDVTLHDLRRTGATWLLEQGVPVPVVQRLGGWSKPGVLLDYYTRVHDEALRSAAACLSRMGTPT